MRFRYLLLFVLAMCLFVKAVELFIMTLGLFCLMGAALFAFAMVICWGKARSSK